MGPRRPLRRQGSEPLHARRPRDPRLTDELKLHIRGALNLGHTPDDIAELFVQLLPYVGTPRMVQAMRLAGEVFREGQS